MNIFKKFLRSDNYTDTAEDELYTPFDDEKPDEEEAPAVAAGIAAVDDPERKNPEIRPASSEKVSLKIINPKSQAEAPVIANQLKEGNIILLDISNMAKDQAVRLVDFLAGAAFVLGGEIRITNNRSTIIISPIGVDITGFVPDLVDEDEEDEDEDSEDEDEYGEIEEPEEQ